MGTSMQAWLDYEEEIVGAEGRRQHKTQTLAGIEFIGDYVLYELLANVRPGVIEYVVGEAWKIDPLGMERWSHVHPDPVVCLKPKGLPERLGFRPEEYLAEWFGYARPGGLMHPIFPKHGGQGTYTWPPEEVVDHHSFSWLTAAELAAVADRYAAIPNINCASVNGTWCRVAGNHRPPDGRVDGVPQQVAFGRRNVEVDAVVAMMERLNAGDPDRSRLVFWFDN